ncbi:hypothetical protein [Sphingosinicella sp.]|uniref:hypothetical protein n=1 Tax=Sphingosinicella sp. TaxID=1917971 RepID=UPI0040380BC1
MDLALAALIAAYHESGEAGALRAVLPLAGRTLIERQVRLAARAGATRIIVVVERLPAELGAALERLRRDRLPVHIARDVEEAAEAIEPADRLLMIGDGAVIDENQLARLAEGSGHAVLTVPDSVHGELYERIDGQSRWGGAAAMDGHMLHATAAMVRDWDLQSTLLRRTLQAGARHVAADRPLAIIDRAADVAALEGRILADALETRGSWIDRLLAPVERLLASALLGGSVGPGLIGGVAAGFTALGAAGFAWGWNWSGLALMLLATPLEGTALRVGRARLLDDPARSWWRQLLPALSGTGLFALGYGQAAAQGWGTILLAAMTIAFMIALSEEREKASIPGSVALADRKGLSWLMLPLAGFGGWLAGLAGLFAYAAGSFFWAQRHAHRPKDQD